MKGIRTFYLLTLSQVISIIGSRMTWTAVGIKIFTDTGNSTPIIMTAFFAALPPVIAGSCAGVLVDRWNRKTVLFASDLAQGLLTCLLFLSFYSNLFEIWHLYAISLAQGFLAMLQRPAMDASITVLVPDGHRDRANAIRQIVGPMAGIIAPPITGVLFALIGITGIIGIDLVTLAIALSVLFFIWLPQPEIAIEESIFPSSFLSELKTGFQFLWSRRVLFNLMLYAALVNCLMAGPFQLITPYLLTLTKSEATLGVLLGIMDVGMVVGGVIVVIWGGKRPRIQGVILGVIFRAIWFMIFGLSRTVPALGVSLFFLLFSNTLIAASFTSILQQKTPVKLQGRIFALRVQLMYVANPISLFITGPLVDKWLTPAMQKPAWKSVAPIVSSSPGSELGLVFLVSGFLVLIITLFVYASPEIRGCEANLPDQPLERDISATLAAKAVH